MCDELGAVTCQAVHFVEAHVGSRWEADARQRGYCVGHLTGRQLICEADLFRELAAAWRFPEYFGHNWDALDECLRDLAWLPAPGYVLLIDHSQGLWRREPRLPATLVEIWLAAAESWARTERPFHLVFQW